MMHERKDIETLINRRFEQHHNACSHNDAFVQSVMHALPSNKNTDTNTTITTTCYALFIVILLATTAWNLPIIGWYYDFTSWFLLSATTELLYVAMAIFVSFISTLWSLRKSIYFLRY